MMRRRSLTLILLAAALAAGPALAEVLAEGQAKGGCSTNEVCFNTRFPKAT